MGSDSLDGTAIIYCEGSYGNAYGKTAHGLVRFSRRYGVAAVIDSTLAGSDAGELLDGQHRGIPVVADLAGAIRAADVAGTRATHLVIGTAPDGGRMDRAMRTAVLEAIDGGLHVDSGLHDFLADDAEIQSAAFAGGVRLRDIRRPPGRGELHFFSGKIAEVDSLVVAVLGTDSAVGKRTTAWMLVDGLEAAGCRSVLVGTGQTAWLQGGEYGVRMDALVNDFVAGEIEHAVWLAWSQERPRVIVVEGQGSLLHPAYPGGFEIIGAARPGAIVLQHAPARRTYDGFDDFPLHPLEHQIRALELVAETPVVAVTLNCTGLPAGTTDAHAAEIARTCPVPVVDPVREGVAPVVEILRRSLVDPA